MAGDNSSRWHGAPRGCAKNRGHAACKQPRTAGRGPPPGRRRHPAHAARGSQGCGNGRARRRRIWVLQVQRWLRRHRGAGPRVARLMEKRRTQERGVQCGWDVGCVPAAAAARDWPPRAARVRTNGTGQRWGWRGAAHDPVGTGRERGRARGGVRACGGWRVGRRGEQVMHGRGSNALGRGEGVIVLQS